jgi:hypothetical protein
MAIEGKQGLVTMTTPVEVKLVKNKVRIELKGHTFHLQWNADFIDTNEIQLIREFVELVYKAGFSDGASKAMTPSEQRQDRIAEIICGALNNKK